MKTKTSHDFALQRRAFAWLRNAQSQPSPSKKKLQVSNKCMYHIFRHLNFRQKLFLTRNISMGSRVIFSQFTSVTGRAVWNVVSVLAFVFSFTCWVVTGMDSCAHCTIDQELFSYSRSWRQLLLNEPVEKYFYTDMWGVETKSLKRPSSITLLHGLTLYVISDDKFGDQFVLKFSGNFFKGRNQKNSDQLCTTIMNVERVQVRSQQTLLKHSIVSLLLWFQKYATLISIRFSILASVCHSVKYTK